MRYDTPIYFQHPLEPVYDETTGNYKELPPDEDRRMAAVMDTSEERLQIYYGTVPQGALTISLQTHYDRPFTRIRIGEKFYEVDRERKLRTKHTMFVHEVL